MAKMTDTAAAAAIGAASRELRLPVVRTDAARLAEIAQRSQLSYMAHRHPRPPPRRRHRRPGHVQFNAHIIETGTDSYRPRATKTRTRRKPA